MIQKINKVESRSKINIIDKGFYSTKTISWFLNRDFIFEKSSILIIKNLKLLHSKNLNIKTISHNKDRKNPNIFILIHYIFRPYYEMVE